MDPPDQLNLSSQTVVLPYPLTGVADEKRARLQARKDGRVEHLMTGG